MKIVFLSNYYNHHQSALARRLQRLSEGCFSFIKTTEIGAERVALGWKTDEPEYVLGVALPFGERKGFSDFMRLRKELTDKYRIVMVGLSDKQIAALPPGITGIRRTNDVHALAALYANARCFANLTQEDNFPTTNIESLMCGTPVVTYDTGGSPESVFAGAGEAVTSVP